MKKMILVLISLILLLSLLNPSLNRFKEFSAGREKYYVSGDRRAYSVVRRRTENYIMFSIFEIGNMDPYGKYTVNKKYIGILSNFAELRENIKIPEVSKKRDTIFVPLHILVDSSSVR